MNTQRNWYQKKNGNAAELAASPARSCSPRAAPRSGSRAGCRRARAGSCWSAARRHRRRPRGRCGHARDSRPNVTGVSSPAARSQPISAGRRAPPGWSRAGTGRSGRARRPRRSGRRLGQRRERAEEPAVGLVLPRHRAVALPAVAAQQVEAAVVADPGVGVGGHVVDRVVGQAPARPGSPRRAATPGAGVRPRAGRHRRPARSAAGSVGQQRRGRAGDQVAAEGRVGHGAIVHGRGRAGFPGDEPKLPLHTPCAVCEEAVSL